jgi:hypothetical protein
MPGQQLDHRRIVPILLLLPALWVAVQFPWSRGLVSEEGGERVASLVGGEQVAEVGEQGSVL